MTININNKYFFSEQNGSIIKLYIDYSIFLENESFSHKDKLLEFLDIVNANIAIKTLVICNNNPTYQLDIYKDKWDMIYEDPDFESNMLRVFRTYNQVFLKIKSLQKIVVTVLAKPTNLMLFSLGMAADLRIVTRDFFINNDNYNFVNIPKGGASFNETQRLYINPIKKLFQTDKIYSSELYQKHLVDEVYNPEELMERVMRVASRYNKYSYIELEAVKAIDQNKLKRLDLILQKENDFLLSCIRKKKNSASS